MSPGIQAQKNIQPEILLKYSSSLYSAVTTSSSFPKLCFPLPISPARSTKRIAIYSNKKSLQSVTPTHTINFTETQFVFSDHNSIIISHTAAGLSKFEAQRAPGHDHSSRHSFESAGIPGAFVLRPQPNWNTMERRRTRTQI